VLLLNSRNSASYRMDAAASWLAFLLRMPELTNSDLNLLLSVLIARAVSYSVLSASLPFMFITVVSCQHLLTCLLT